MGRDTRFLHTRRLSNPKFLSFRRFLLLLLILEFGSEVTQAAHLFPYISGQQSSGQHGAGRSGTTDDAARLAAAAQEAMRNRDFATAIHNFEALVRIAPDRAEIHANLATAYHFAGRFDDAVREGHAAVKLNPSLTTAHVFLGLSLAESAHCKEALPYLEKDYARSPDAQLRRTVGTDALHCAMDLNDLDKTFEFVRVLNRDFPDDPDFLYLSSHLYSDLSTQSSQRLLATAPGSFQAHQLNAEVLAIQGKTAEAVEEYRKVLTLQPNLSDVHYEIGRLLLADESGPNTLDQARQEFETELKIDPRNAVAQYELGEMARQARQWDIAIGHFQQAAKLDSQFAEALIGLGKSLVSAAAQDAVAPLLRAVELEPDNPNAHYQLSFVYRRLGREQEAVKELAAYRQTHDRLAQSRQRVRAGILGNIAQPQTDSPPE